MDRKGVAYPIPEDIKNFIKGISMPENSDIEFDDLLYLTIPHYDFDYNIHEGEMIADKNLADEILDIFAELYDIKYPIESMCLIDHFNNKQTEEFDNLDRASMGNNNTSCFCYRTVNGTDRMSNHAYGRAIDVNPKINPWVMGDEISPKNAVKYSNREGDFEEYEAAAMIHKGDDLYNIFIKYGWEWGGEIWGDEKDYHHFQKK